jgi:hypothetical protein
LNDPAIKRLNELRHTHFAHAGARRAPQQGQSGGLTMNDVTAAQRALFRTASAISSLVLQHSSHMTALATPQYDQFRHWDCPMVASEDIGKLREWWHRHTEDHRRFSDGLTEALLNEFRNRRR